MMIIEFKDSHYGDRLFPCIYSENNNPTNGDIIRALFPNGKVIETEDGDIGYEIYIDKNYSFCSWFDGTWWSAPYKKGDKE